jgi:phosphatidylglycerol:prolipoprotein diacylglycerol transferase
VLPYLQEPTLRIGSLTLHAFGGFVAAAVLVGCWLVLRRAERQGLSLSDTRSLLLWMLGLGFIGSHFEHLVYYEPWVLARADPLRLLNLWSGMSSFGGILGGVLGGLFFMRRRRWSGGEMLLHLDLVAFAFPFGWTVARAGCSLAHDHPGIHTASWLAVRFPDGPRYDLGLFDFFLSLLIAGLFLLLDRHRRPAGFYLFLFMVLYGSARLLLDPLRDEERFLGFTSGQYGAILAILVGVALLRGVVTRNSRNIWRKPCPGSIGG